MVVFTGEVLLQSVSFAGAVRVDCGSTVIATVEVAPRQSSIVPLLSTPFGPLVYGRMVYVTTTGAAVAFVNGPAATDSPSLRV